MDTSNNNKLILFIGIDLLSFCFISAFKILPKKINPGSPSRVLGAWSLAGDVR